MNIGRRLSLYLLHLYFLSTILCTYWNKKAVGKAEVDNGGESRVTAWGREREPGKGAGEREESGLGEEKEEDSV